MLDFRAERQTQPIARERDFILHEAVEPLLGNLRGQKSQDGAVGDVVVIDPIAESPDDVVSLSRAKMVLEIGVVDVDVLSKGAGNVPVGPVDIHLKREIGGFGKRVGPAAEYVAAAHGNVAQGRLRNPAVVGVALNREMVDGREVRFEPKPSLSHVPAVGRLPALR